MKGTYRATKGKRWKENKKAAFDFLFASGVDVRGWSYGQIAEHIRTTYPDFMQSRSIFFDLGDKGIISAFGSPLAKGIHQDKMNQKYHEAGCFVYVAGSVPLGYVKIGFSRQLRKRFENLQVANPYPLFIFRLYKNRGRKFEEYLHDRYAEYRAEGEWFKIEGRIFDLLHTGKPRAVSAFVCRNSLVQEARHLVAKPGLK